MTNVQNITSENSVSDRVVRPFSRALIFSLLFFLVMTAYYQVKPSSHSLFITFLGTENLPYMWIASALILAILLPFFFWVAERSSPLHFVTASSICFAVLLLIFWRLLGTPTAAKVVTFYILVDIYSVILIEHFWGLVGSLYHTSEGKRWYGVIGSGALLGGMAGSALASFALAYTGLNTVDLLLVAVVIVLLVAAITSAMIGWNQRASVLPEDTSASSLSLPRRQSQPGRRYVLLVTLLVLFTQLIEPVIEYQFMTILQQTRTDLQARTEYLSCLFVATSTVALAVNLVVTPLVHRYFGTIAGLTLQPLMLILGSCWFVSVPTLSIGAMLKILDRSLSYSINRASKELLYLPLTPASIYKVKSWVDIFGYRIFKTIASLLILAVTQWLPIQKAIPDMSWIVVFFSFLWLLVTWKVGPRYNDFLTKSEAIDAEEPVVRK